MNKPSASRLTIGSRYVPGSTKSYKWNLLIRLEERLEFPEKLIFIGVDGAIPDFTEKMVEGGGATTLSRLF